MKKKFKICFTLDGIYDYIFHIPKFCKGSTWESFVLNSKKMLNF